MKLGKGHNRLGEMVYNSFILTVREEFLQGPHPIQLPGVAISSKSSHNRGDEEVAVEAKPKRRGRGCQAVPVIRSLMASSENWYTLAVEEHYHFPGIFPAPYLQRMGYCMQ